MIPELHLADFCREVACTGVTVTEGYGIPWQNSEGMERMERMDAPGLDGRCLFGLSGRTESEAAQMSHWMYLHQR